MKLITFGMQPFANVNLSLRFDVFVYLRLAELDKVLVGGSRWQTANIQVGLTELLRPSLAAAVGAGAGRSHGMRGWSIGLLEETQGENKDLLQTAKIYFQ